MIKCFFVFLSVCFNINMTSLNHPPLIDSPHSAFRNSVSKEKEAILFHFRRTPVEIVAWPGVCTADQQPAMKVRAPLGSLALMRLLAMAGICGNGLFLLQWPCNSGMHLHITVCLPFTPWFPSSPSLPPLLHCFSSTV